MRKLLSSQAIRRRLQRGTKVEMTAKQKTAMADKRASAAPDGNESSRTIRIGGRLRHARLMKGMNLKAVAAGVGCSESFISKLENDKVQPSLAVLHKLVALLGINVTAIFSNGASGDGPLFVMKSGQRPTISTRLRQKADGVVLEQVVPQTRNALLQVNIHQVVPGGSSHGLITHVGEEMGYVLEGMLDLTV